MTEMDTRCGDLSNLKESTLAEHVATDAAAGNQAVATPGRHERIWGRADAGNSELAGRVGR
jgi:hypothetical protein